MSSFPPLVGMGVGKFSFCLATETEYPGLVSEVLMLMSGIQSSFYFWVSSWYLLLKCKVSNTSLSTHQGPHTL